MTQINQPRGPGRHRLARVFRSALPYAGSAIALYLIFRLLPGRQVLRALAALPSHLWILALAGYLAAHCIGVAKYRLVLGLAGARLDYRQASRCYFAGLFGSLFLPSVIGGDLLRAALAMGIARSKTSVLLGSLADRILDFTALALLALTGALLVPGGLDANGRGAFLWLGIASAVAIAALALAIMLVPARRLSWRMRRRLVRLRRAWRSMSARPASVVRALGLGLCVQMCFVLLSITLADACGLHVAFRDWLFAWPLAKLSAAIPVTQAGIGVREAALAALLLPFGAPAALTIAAGLAWEAIVVSGAICGGAYWLATRNSSAKRGQAVAGVREG